MYVNVTDYSNGVGTLACCLLLFRRPPNLLGREAPSSALQRLAVASPRQVMSTLGGSPVFCQCAASDFRFCLSYFSYEPIRIHLSQRQCVASTETLFCCICLFLGLGWGSFFSFCVCVCCVWCVVWIKLRRRPLQSFKAVSIVIYAVNWHTRYP